MYCAYFLAAKPTLLKQCLEALGQVLRERLDHAHVQGSSSIDSSPFAWPLDDPLAQIAGFST